VPDVLRGVAILAMLIAHAVPLLPQTSSALRFLMYNINDVASPLFALVMGMSAQIVAQRTARPQRGRMLVQQVVRGLLLIALGLWMTEWGSWVAIVLSQLGVLLIVGVPLVLLSSRWLAVVTAAVALLSAPVNAWARSELSWMYSDPDGPASTIAQWVALGTHYRVTNLLPFFLFGALLLRHGFRRDVVLWAMLAVAPLAYLVVPTLERVRPSSDVSSGALPDTLHDVGLVCLVYVVVVVLATVHSPGPQRVVAAAFEPLRAAGALALSLYVLHVAVLALWAPGGERPPGNDLLGWLVVVPGTMAAAYLWWRFVGTGPVEWLMGVVTGRLKPLRRTP
jgi:uncharacterized protein